jgi:hypothetical protein
MPPPPPWRPSRPRSSADLPGRCQTASSAALASTQALAEADGQPDVLSVPNRTVAD